MKEEASIRSEQNEKARSFVTRILLLVFCARLFLVLLVEGGALLVQLLPGTESSEGALAVGVDVLESVDVTGVDPTEAVIVSEMH
jgi:hypothetical protein